MFRQKCPCLRPQEEEVRVLDYRHSSLDQVPPEVFNFERTLEELYVDANNIKRSTQGMKFIPHTAYATLLPPANEVWGNLIFLHLFVILFTGGVPDTHPPGPGTPPRTRYTPRPGTPPGTRYTPLGPGAPPQTRYTPKDQVHPLGPDTPPGPGTQRPGSGTPPGPGTPPRCPVQSMLGDMVNTRAVCILLECNLVF